MKRLDRFIEGLGPVSGVLFCLVLSAAFGVLVYVALGWVAPA